MRIVYLEQSKQVCVQHFYDCMTLGLFRLCAGSAAIRYACLWAATKILVIVINVFYHYFNIFFSLLFQPSSARFAGSYIVHRSTEPQLPCHHHSWSNGICTAAAVLSSPQDIKVTALIMNATMVSWVLLIFPVPSPVRLLGQPDSSPRPRFKILRTTLQ
jgi:hypothetical protein